MQHDIFNLMECVAT